MTCEQPATVRLREMLDERVVEWRGGLPTETIVTDPIDVLYVQKTDGMMHVYFRSYLTPEQAIEVTLGRGTCHVELRKDGWGATTEHCGNCGADLGCDTRNTQYFCPNCGKRIVKEDA